MRAAIEVPWDMADVLNGTTLRAIFKANCRREEADFSRDVDDGTRRLLGQRRKRVPDGFRRARKEERCWIF